MTIEKPRPRIFTSNNRTYFLAVLPATKKGTKHKAIAYKVLPDGTFKKLWEIGSWPLGSSTLLLDDGVTLITIKSSFGNKPSKEEAVLRFYSNGKEIAKYSAITLVKDLSKIPQMSHFYRWRRGNSYSIDGDKFIIRTIDATASVFNAKTGTIISQKKDLKYEKRLYDSNEMERLQDRLNKR